MTNQRSRVTVFAFIALCLSLRVVAADYWAPFGDPAVMTNNDCGYVSDVSGAPVIRRPFQDDKHPGVPAHIADRINSGDILIVPPGGRLEWTSGSNIIVTLGSKAQVKLGGLRSFAGPDGVVVTRLDFIVESGELRAQVRLNEERPEAVLATLNGAEILVRRGDVAMFSNSTWRGTTLEGEAFARIRRGGVFGAPFVISLLQQVGPGGEDMVSEEEQQAVRGRVPFSFELVKAALPPLPSPGSSIEAP